jgi:hypothetical protein
MKWQENGKIYKTGRSISLKKKYQRPLITGAEGADNRCEQKGAHNFLWITSACRIDESIDQ